MSDAPGAPGEGDPPGSRHAAPALAGGLLALAAALLFGIGTPLVKRFGEGVGPFTTAALLYLGALVLGVLMRRPVAREAALGRRDLSVIAWMALFGAGIGPVALAWGLAQADAASASLVLALEAGITVILAAVFHGEDLDRRVRLAVVLLLAGGIVLVLDPAAAPLAGHVAGLAAVALATLAWAIDNTLSRAVAERDPARVLAAKSAIGVAFTATVAWAVGESAPAAWRALALAAVGATAFGLSLRVYLLAQRAFGAARTASVFAFAPFIGAAFALVLDATPPGPGLLVAGALMLAGIVLHLGERHDHFHVHEAVTHEHAHVHDDGHHTHVHEPMPSGPHSHPHTHAPVAHAHAHVPDLHHRHRHGPAG